jgi:hypothetical protein
MSAGTSGPRLQGAQGTLLLQHVDIKEVKAQVEQIQPTPRRSLYLKTILLKIKCTGAGPALAGENQCRPASW